MGPSIGNDLDAALEHYVGRQLAQASHEALIPEIAYGQPQRRTVDWFMVIGEVVLLIEVKAPRLTEAARLGDDEALAHDLERTIGKARQQIERSAALMALPPPELTAAGLPVGLAVCGLIVTLEPYHLVQSGLVDDMLRSTAVPTSVVSIHELEQLVALARNGPDLGQQLAQVQQDLELSTWGTLSAVRHVWPEPIGDNPIVIAAGEELAWHPPGPPLD